MDVTLAGDRCRARVIPHACTVALPALPARLPRGRGRERGIGLLDVVHAVGRPRQQPIVAADTQPSAHPAGPARALDQLAALDPERVLELGDLGREDRAVRAVRIDAVVAGRVAAGTASAAENVGEQRQPAGAGVDRLEHECRERHLARGDRSLGKQLAERLDDDVGEPLHGEMPGAQRRREDRVEHDPSGAITRTRL